MIKAKKKNNKVIGYQIYNEGPPTFNGKPEFFEVHDAQNVQDLLAESFRSINFSARNVLGNMNKLIMQFNEI